MKQYIGTKIIKAEPAYRVDGKVFVKANIVPSGVHIEDGYKVVYPDGYESWSPKDVFEAAYRATDGMSFGLAIEAAKMGKKISRASLHTTSNAHQRTSIRICAYSRKKIAT